MFLRHSFYSTEFHTERTIKHIFALKAGVKNTAEDIFGSELFSSEHKKESRIRIMFGRFKEDNKIYTISV